MSDSTIDPDTTPAAEAGPEQEQQSDEALLSGEAKKYRLKLREAEQQNAELVIQITDLNARAEAAERQVVEANLRGRFADASDFWKETQLGDLRGEDGALDINRVTARADELLAEHPHWAAPNPAAPLAAAAGSVNGAGRIGMRPSGVLDGDTVQPQPARGWSGFLSEAARGTT